MATHIYRMNSSLRIFCIVFFLFGLVGLVGIWSGVISGTRDPNFLEMMIPLCLAIGGAVFIIRSFRNSIRLSETVIEVRGLSGKRELPLDRIQGRRRYFVPGDAESPGVWNLVLESNDDRYPRLDIQEEYRFDDYFNRWFSALPDLDELDKNKPKNSNFGLV